MWDVKKRVLLKLIELETEELIGCSTSANNILAIGSDDKTFSLWDTRKWEMFWSQKYEMEPMSVHLSNDSKYLTVGGWRGEKCVVLDIK